jgi:uncharacterized membrane protein
MGHLAYFDTLDLSLTWESYMPYNPLIEEITLMRTTTSSPMPKRSSRADHIRTARENLIQYWFYLFAGLGIFWIIVPWLAPIFMQFGWEGLATTIYNIYSFLCHQLPQRSFFLFGSQTMYSLDQIQAVGVNIDIMLELRRFIGNPEMGYKVAWSDRMVSAYGIIPVAALFWWPLRKRLRSLPVWGFAILALPMFVDGGTHFLSDLAGIGQGFRYTNDWLVALSSNIFPTTFYVGNALGSFNSWMRLITGTLFGVGLVWMSLPLFWETALQSTKQSPRLNRGNDDRNFTDPSDIG